MKKEIQFFLIIVLATSLVTSLRAETTPSAKTPSPVLPTCEACKIVLISPRGIIKGDLEISDLQKKIKTSATPALLLEQLGWLFVSRARSANDPGLYNLAEQCAVCIASHEPESAAALLLRGHALQSMHKFKEAEPIALQLVQKRGASFDYGLLGDILMDRGQVAQGIEAYQKMMELKPDLHAYTRGAHARWITGDLDGALELISLATSAGSSRNAEATAWSYTRRAAYEFQNHQLSKSILSVNAALELQPDYAAALFFRGRIELAQGQTNNAIKSLERAAELNPLPEYQWILVDALNLAGRKGEGVVVEAELNKRGAQEDPRTFACYLATRHDKGDLAVKLCERELSQRADIFTHDALAWSLNAAGKFPEARTQSGIALSEGTEDARLFFHAAIIAEANGDSKEVARFSQKATAIQQMLFTSEQQQIAELNGRLVGAQNQAKITEIKK
ncbi:MAG: tetratricopeptide repeat protein [Verrucomicrobiota bacterium]